jgi:hypothetical protein
LETERTLESHIARALVTVGLATRLVDQGVGAVPDAVFRGSGDRVMYSSVQPEREWGFFVAASVGVMQ